MNSALSYVVLIVMAVILTMSVTTLQFPTGEILKQPRGELPTVIEPEVTPAEEIPAEEISTEEVPIERQIKITEDMPVHILSTNISGCGVISSPGDYVLDSDISDNTTEYCILINSSNVVFDGNGNTMDGISQTTSAISNYPATNITIKNLIIKNFEYGIGLYTINDTVIDNNTLTSNSESAIYLNYPFGTFNVNITNNNITNNNRSALQILAGNHVQVHGNNISYNARGISVSETDNINITNNLVASNAVIGIGIYGQSYYNEITENDIRDNANKGIEFIGAYNNAIKNNNFTNNTIGIGFSQRSTYINITNNLFDSNSEAGVQILRAGGKGGSAATNISVKNNTFTDNEYGIYTNADEGDNTFDNNTLTSNDVGMRIGGGYVGSDYTNNNISGCITGISMSGDDDLYANNSITNNTDDGMHILYLGSSTIINNNLSYNGVNGLHFDSSVSGSNIIANNTITGNAQNGINISNSRYVNTISGNYISENNYSGIYSLNSGYIVISNNLIENENQPIRLDNTSYYNIEDNTINGSSSSKAIAVYDSDSAIIDGNIIGSYTTMIFLNNTNNSILTNMDLYVEGTVGYDLINSVNNTISDGIINCSTADGIWIEGYGIENYFVNNTVRNMTITSCEDSIYLDYASGNILDNNTIINNNGGEGRYPIVFNQYSEYNTISNNNISFNLNDAIYLMRGSNNNIISNNVIANNSGYGVTCPGGGMAGGGPCYNNTITSNLISNNSDSGIWLVAGSGGGIVIDNNTISFNQCGFGTCGGIVLYGEGSDSNTVTRNNVYSNAGHGIVYDSGSSTANAVINNNIVNFNGADGIFVDNTHYVPSNVTINVSYNDVQSNGYGLDLGGQKIIVHNNDVRSNNFSGIYVGAKDTKVYSNYVRANGVYSNDYGTSCELSGIELRNDNITVSNNYFDTNHGDGITVQAGSENNLIETNQFYDNCRGIALNGTDLISGYVTNNTIKNNTITTSSGLAFIYLNNSFNNIIDNNRNEPDDYIYYGIILDFSPNNTIKNNVFYKPVGSGTTQGAISLRNASNNNIIKNNTLTSGNSGIKIYDSNNVQLLKNNFIQIDIAKSAVAAVYMLNANNTSLIQNTFSQNRHDLVMYTSNNTVINNNLFDSSGDTYVASSYNTMINHNTFIDSIITIYSDNTSIENNNMTTCPYISVYGSNNRIESNTMTQNFCTDAITIVTGTGNIIKSNKITNAIDGISILTANNNVTLNEITGCSAYGIHMLSSASSNNIWNNKFVNNVISAVDGSGTNKWNTTQNCGSANILGGPCVGGNYWSDYTGVDNTGDYLGDTKIPYNASGNITNGGDYLPLLVPPEEERIIGALGSGLPVYSIVAIPDGQLITFNNILVGTYKLAEITGNSIWTSKIVILQQINGKLEIVQGATPSESADGKIYTYISAEITGFDQSAIDTFTLSFKVPKTWLTENGLSSGDISLLHYDGTSWNTLPTSVTSEDNDYVYFDATSSDLSYFAIGQQNAKPSFMSILNAISNYYAGKLTFVDVLNMIASYYKI